MAIRRVEIENFLVFNGEFAAEFCPGVNVLIGGNATGKTTLMKVLYWACETSDQSVYDEYDAQKKPDNNLTLHLFALRDYFSAYTDYIATNNAPDSDEYISKIRVIKHVDDITEAVLRVSVNKSLDKVRLHIADKTVESLIQHSLWCKERDLPSTFIPTTEMLSHSRKFLALYRERYIPFNKTEVDILSKAELGPTREITPNAAKVLGKIEAVIDGTVWFDGEDFYVVNESSNKKVKFSFEASGYRKLGLLWSLLRNGLLESGTILFWDEPENSLNPEHMSTLVDVLLELSRGGIQIFIATHSKILASYFAVNRQKEEEVLFLSLYKEGKQIRADADTRFDLLEPNNLTAEGVKLYEKELDKSLGGS